MNAVKTSRTAVGDRKWAGGWFALILVALVVSGGAAWYFLGSPAQAQPGSTTTTAIVQRGDIRLTASGSGTLVTNQVVNMSFSTSGKVAELNVKLGNMVKTGDVLARLEKAEDLEANLASAQAQLLQAQQALDALQKSAGLTLAQAYQDSVAAQAAYEDALAASQRTASARCSAEIMNKYQSALDQAAEKLGSLVDQDPYSDAAVIARYDYDTALANYSYCTAFTATEKLSAESELEIARADLQEAQDTYNTLKEASGIDPDAFALNETKVETAQTQVNTAQEALDGITLTASMDGKITYLAAGVGTIVDTSTFLTISDVSHPTVTVSLDETDMDKLAVGNPAVVTFTALPGKTFTGTVSLVNPQMNSFGPFRAATGQVELDEEAVKTLETPPLGLSAVVTITGEEEQDVLTVPVAALKRLNNGDYGVNVVGSDGQITQQTVTVGIQDDTNVEIISGLNEGDIVSITAAANNSGSEDGREGGPLMDGGMPPMP